MKLEEKQKILQRLTTRVATGLSFIQFNYLNQHATPDAAWIRNIYILLSFYTELLLKAIYVSEKEYVDLKALDKIFRNQGHNLQEIGNQIGGQILMKYGILAIELKNHEYHLRTDTCEFFVTDFTDIRYDFMDDRVRTISGDEHEMFEAQITALHRINAFLKGVAWA